MKQTTTQNTIFIEKKMGGGECSKSFATDQTWISCFSVICQGH